MVTMLFELVPLKQVLFMFNVYFVQVQCIRRNSREYSCLNIGIEIASVSAQTFIPTNVSILKKPRK